MSLTSFIKLPEVREKMKPLRPQTSRRIPAPLRVSPCTQNYSIVGTAFDYLLGIELKRRAPHAKGGRCIAHPGQGISGISVCEFMEKRDKICEIHFNATTAHANYLRTPEPTHSQQAEVAALAIRSAKLDSQSRVGQLNPHFEFEEAAQEDIEDLLTMIAIVPFDELLHEETMLLSPTFGSLSQPWIEGEADLISGNMLVDIKTTKKAEMNSKDLDQLLGYFLLATRHRRTNPSFPEIKKAALYFSRHGYLWPLDTSVWTENPVLSDLEKWFFDYARKLVRK